MTETPQPRRSTRGASTRAGSATPAPSVAGRRTRAKTPKAAAALPAVPTATSHAYGSRGKVSLATQVDVAGGEGGFAAAFGARRGVALNRDVDRGVASDDDDEDDVDDPDARGGVNREDENDDNIVVNDPVGVSTRRARQPSIAPTQASARTTTRTRQVLSTARARTYQAPQPDFHRGSPSLQEDGDESQQVISNTPQFPSYTDLDTQFTYGNPNDDRSPSRSRNSLARSSLEPPASVEEIEAARPWSFEVLCETFVRWAKVPLVPMVDFLCGTGGVVLLSLLPLVLLGLLYPSAVSTIAEQGRALGSKITPTWGGTSVPDISLLHRVENLESDVRQIRKELRATTYKLGEILPEHLMVQKNDATGEWDLPANFWNALRERLAHEGSAIAWDEFIATNKEKLERTARESVDIATSKNEHVITQQQFIDRVQQVAAEVGSRSALKMIKSLPKGDKGSNLLYNLVLANLAHNTELAISSVNYFSYGLGAVIDPFMSSPTHEKEKSIFHRALPKWVLSDGPTTHPPNKMLQRWEEATDCWCAAQSDPSGKAQVAVIMARSIVPSSITIEHIPARGTLDIGAAPKEFEVWVRNTENYAYLPQDGSDAGPPCSSQPPRPNFVCIGKGNYDVNGPNHVQNFALDSSRLAGPVNKAVVMIKNNWGQNYTCLYRMRMHGESENLY